MELMTQTLQSVLKLPYSYKSYVKGNRCLLLKSVCFYRFCVFNLSPVRNKCVKNAFLSADRCSLNIAHCISKEINLTSSLTM